MKCTLQLILTGVTALLLVGCAGTGPKFNARDSNLSSVTNLTTVAVTNQIAPGWLRPSTNLFTLGPGDRLDIEIMDDPTTRSTVLVGPDGRVYYYLLPGLDVWGLTLAQAKTRLEHELTKYIRSEPRLAVALHTVESKRVWLLGQLRTPGIYPLATETSLLELIARAGGPASSSGPASLESAAMRSGLSSPTEESADLQHSFVIRQGQLVPVDFQRLLLQGDLSQNIYLQPDDFVYLASAVTQNIYVLGAVGQPKVISFTGQISLVSAIARAGGTVKDAYLSHVAIVRGSMTEPSIAVVDYQEIVRGRAPDILLEPRDIVHVPLTPYKTLAKYADLIVSAFVRTVGVNEGARAVSRGTPPIGVNVPVGF
jgi:polysaccharide export outer membrane protein